jgi:hypothetical protein
LTDLTYEQCQELNAKLAEYLTKYEVELYLKKGGDPEWREKYPLTKRSQVTLKESEVYVDSYANNSYNKYHWEKAVCLGVKELGLDPDNVVVWCYSGHLHVNVRTLKSLGVGTRTGITNEKCWARWVTSKA